jgi:hypothetical protein
MEEKFKELVSEVAPLIHSFNAFIGPFTETCVELGIEIPEPVTDLEFATLQANFKGMSGKLDKLVERLDALESDDDPEEDPPELNQDGEPMTETIVETDGADTSVPDLDARDLDKDFILRQKQSLAKMVGQM